MKRVRVWKNGVETTALVAEEKELSVNLNGRTVAELLMSPGLEKEAVIGFLAGEGLIKCMDDILEIEMTDAEARVRTRTGPATGCRRYLSSDCAGGWRTRTAEEGVKVESSLRVEAGELVENMKRLHRGSRVWRETGGVHSTVHVWGRDFTIIEDVSRHVALDKAIGRGMMAGADFPNSYILTTGRLPGDMVIKLARVGIPLVASRAAPVYSGIQCALETGVTLVGFLRGERMNIYTFPDRIT
ncbi:MAG: formate dehydrogenase accessory sulfurtransferase FdhD [Euryarchaeota archaeon]|nr:formate dehydrogenase accessory sulfurtransferase FdhD [Euryarchaeota archaeon]